MINYIENYIIKIISLKQHLLSWFSSKNFVIFEIYLKLSIINHQIKSNISHSIPKFSIINHQFTIASIENSI